MHFITDGRVMTSCKDEAAFVKRRYLAMMTHDNASAAWKAWQDDLRKSGASTCARQHDTRAS